MDSSRHGPWAGPPHDGTARIVPVHTAVAQSDRATVSLADVHVFPTGLLFAVEVEATSPDAPPGEFLADGMARDPSGTRPPDAVLRFGVRLADGTRVTTLNSPVVPAGEPTGPVLFAVNGPGFRISGSRLSMTSRLWLWPPPAARLVAFLVEWPAFGVEETTLDLDDEALWRSQRTDR